MKNKIEFFLLLFFYYISRFIGVKLSSNLGGSLAWVYGLFSKRNLIGMKNLNLVFPEEKFNREKKNFKKNVVSFWKSHW